MLDGDPAALPKKGAELPIFGPFLLWPKGCMYQNTTWYGGRPQPRRHCVRWGPALSLTEAHSPSFSANVCCGQMAGWTKMPFGMEVGLGQATLSSIGTQLPRKKSTTLHPIFDPYL